MSTPPFRFFRFASHTRAAVILAGFFLGFAAHAAPVLKALFLGDNGPHRPADRLREIGPAMMGRGIQLVYTEELAALTLENLRRYDALLVDANINAIPPAQDQALADYVAQGGGLFALHGASYCFRNSDRYVALVGAQFKDHATGTFRTRLVAPAHPVMQGFSGFESWDETYVHARHNEQNRTVLEWRDSEPYTWIRTEGKGRVFYTAWGHDQRTWTNPGFHDLAERGRRFAAGQKLPAAVSDRPKIAGLELFDQPGVPYYPPGQRTQGDGRADLREVIMTGWSRSDTHAGPNNLQYGLDNWIRGMLGYSGFAGSVGGNATGAALFDDFALVDLGRSDGAIQNAFNSVIVHVARRASVGAAKISEPAEVPVSDNVGNRVVLHLGTIPDVMKYDRTELTVRAGVTAQLVFKNTDNMQHNVLVLRPGTLEAVGALADQMLADPQALAKNYVPPSSDVLFSTPPVNPNESFELNFTAPTQPGRYPIMCTFPGHWRIIQATLVVQ